MPNVLPMSVLMSGFESFLESALGSCMLDAERHEITGLLPQLVGYNCLQLSVQRAANLCAGEKFGHLIRMGYAPSASDGEQDSVWADYEALPVASDCVDVALLHHVLEFAGEPHQLLREATRTLTAGGHLLIAGFNPLSAWPLYQRYYNWQQLARAPATQALSKQALSKQAEVGFARSTAAGTPRAQAGNAMLKPIRQGRLAEWLSVLNYDVISQKKFFCRPPINSQRWLQRLAALERWAAVAHLPVGMVYITLARKRTLTASPVHTSWRTSMRPARATRAHSQTLHNIPVDKVSPQQSAAEPFATTRPSNPSSRSTSSLHDY